MKKVLFSLFFLPYVLYGVEMRDEGTEKSILYYYDELIVEHREEALKQDQATFLKYSGIDRPKKMNTVQCSFWGFSTIYSWYTAFEYFSKKKEKVTSQTIDPALDYSHLKKLLLQNTNMEDSSTFKAWLEVFSKIDQESVAKGFIVSLIVGGACFVLIKRINQHLLFIKWQEEQCELKQLREKGSSLLVNGYVRREAAWMAGKSKASSIPDVIIQLIHEKIFGKDKSSFLKTFVYGPLEVNHNALRFVDVKRIKNLYESKKDKTKGSYIFRYTEYKSRRSILAYRHH